MTMLVLYVCSSESFTGKSVASIILGRHFQSRGLKVGYFKPLGTQPALLNGVQTDEDAVFIAQALGLDIPPEALCPVLLTTESVRQVFSGPLPDYNGAIERAFAAVSAGKDVVLVGGAGSVNYTGMALGLGSAAVAKRLGAKTLLIGRYTNDRSVETIIAAQALLQDTLVGAIINRVPRPQIEAVQAGMVPFLESRGLQVFGILRDDPVLHSTSVRELAERLGARVLCCPEALGSLVENYSIGAMNVDSALQHFRRIPNKAVITGGDRADIQLAALETSTRCIILTGDLQPDARILARAEEVHVPLLLVREDTLKTVERVEAISGRMRVREPEKIQRALELSREYIDFRRLDKAFGLAQ
jgi:uncharacterized protein